MTVPAVKRWQVAVLPRGTRPDDLEPPEEGFFPRGPWKPVTCTVVLMPFPQETVAQPYICWRRPLFRIPSLPQDDEKVMRSTFTEFVAGSVVTPNRPVPAGWGVRSDWEQAPYDNTCWLRVLTWNGQWRPLV